MCIFRMQLCVLVEHVIKVYILSWKAVLNNNDLVFLVDYV